MVITNIMVFELGGPYLDEVLLHIVHEQVARSITQRFLTSPSKHVRNDYNLNLIS